VPSLNARFIFIAATSRGSPKGTKHERTSKQGPVTSRLDTCTPHTTRDEVSTAPAALAIERSWPMAILLPSQECQVQIQSARRFWTDSQPCHLACILGSIHSNRFPFSFRVPSLTVLVLCPVLDSTFHCHTAQYIRGITSPDSTIPLL